MGVGVVKLDVYGVRDGRWKGGMCSGDVHDVRAVVFGDSLTAVILLMVP